jgi:hypothetical protein
MKELPDPLLDFPEKFEDLSDVLEEFLVDLE